MNTLSSPHGPVARLDLKRAIDAVCDQFEEAWTAGTNPTIENYLEFQPPAARRSFLRELLILECDLRRRRGEHPTAEQYYRRFPEHRGVVAEMLGEVAHTERVQPVNGLSENERKLVRAVQERLARDLPRDRLPECVPVVTQSSRLRFLTTGEQSVGQIWTLLLRRDQLARSNHAAAVVEDVANHVEALARRLLNAFPPTRRCILRSILLGSSASEAAAEHKVTQRTADTTYRTALHLLCGK